MTGGDTATEGTRKSAVPILLFISGFTVVFTFVFGFAASSVGRWLRLPTGQRIAGAIVLAFGVFMVL